nr:transposase [Tessaracoccus massiliensis]
MTHHDQSALKTLISELLDTGPALKRGEAQRRLLEAAMQDLTEAEVTARIGAGRYERNPERVTRRNGTREKEITTPWDLTAEPAAIYLSTCQMPHSS